MLRRMIGSAWFLGTSLATAVATEVDSLRQEGERVRLEATKRIREETGKLRQEGERVRQEAVEKLQEQVEKVRHEAVPAARALFDLHPDRARRRGWGGHRHAPIEGRGVTGSGTKHRPIAARGAARLRPPPGG